MPRCHRAMAVACSLLLTALVLTVTAPARAATSVTLLASGDTQGHLSPCQSCPSTTGLGGMARRATLVQQMRDIGPTLTVDAGNALFGAESFASRGQIIPAAYEAIGYDAINISYRDFRLGKQATLSALEAGDAPAVSANIYDAEQDQPLFKPFVVQQRGGMRWAIIGLTERPVGIDAIPHLKTQLAGIDIRPPHQALARVLPEARAASDRVVVLYYGSAVSARTLTDTIGRKNVSAVIAAGEQPPERGAPTAPVTAWTHKHGTRLTKVSINADGAADVEHIDLDSAIAPSPALEAAIEPLRNPEPDPADVEQSEAARLYERLPAQAKLSPDATYRMNAKGSNRAIHVYIDGAAVRTQYGGRSAPTGHRWLVLDASFENQISLDLMLELEYPEPILIASLPRQCYLLINGRRVQRLAERPKDFPGHLPTGFTLSRAGAVGHGKLVFPIPNEDVRSVSLRYYHDQYAPVTVPLIGDDTQAAQAEPMTPLQENDLMALGVYGFERRESYAGSAAAAGMTYAVADFRGRSRYDTEADALALDADADPDAKARVGKVMEYLKAPGLLQCVVDGEYGYTREMGLGTLEPVPAWLPDVMAGGRAVFLVPKTTESLELVAYFPEFRDTGGRFLGMPEPMRFTLAGDPAEPEPRQSIAVIRDKPTPIGIMDAKLAERAADISAKENQRLLVVTISAKNISDEGGLFNVSTRFKCDIGGRRQSVVATLLPGGVRLREPTWLPAGERRTFDLVFAVPRDTSHPKLHYAGVSVATAVDLDLSEKQLADAEPPDGKPPVQQEQPADAPAPPVAKFTPQPTDESAASIKPDAQVWPSPDPDGADQENGALEPEGGVALNAVGENGAVRLRLQKAHFLSEFHGKEPADGQMFLALQTTWQRLKRAGDQTGEDGQRDEPEKYRLEPLREYLIGVIDGKRTRVLRHIRHNPLTLPRDLRLYEPGATQQGLVLFEVPESGLRSFELCLLNADHGNIRLKVLPHQAPFPAADTPAHPLQRNRVAEVGVFGYRFAERFKGEHPPDDTEWFVVDVRARSLLRTAPVTPGEAPVPLPLHWRGWLERVQLVIDGIDPILAGRHTHNMPEPLRLLPAAHTGGQVAFALPREALDRAGSVELLCGFAPVSVPGERVIAPKPIRFALKGERLQVKPVADPLLTVNDLDATLHVTAQRTPADIRGRKPRRGRYWLALDFDVRAKSDAGVMFLPADRFHVVDDRRQRLNWHSDTRYTAHPPPRRKTPFWIPPGARRRFTMVWQVPEGNRAPRFYYTGLLNYRSYALRPVDAAVTKNNAEAKSDKAEQAMPVPRPEQNLLVADTGVQVLHPDREPTGIRGVGLTAKQVNDAIDRGRDFLWRYLQEEAGHRPIGHDKAEIPAMLALVHCDAHELYPEFNEAVDAFLRRVQPRERNVYENGLIAMLIESYGDPTFLPKLEQVVHYLIEAQGEGGTWTYNSPVPRRFFPAPEASAEPDEQTMRVIGGRPIVEPDLPEEPFVRTQPWPLGEDGDNSCTQFAVLGLWSGVRAGIPVDPDVWQRILKAKTHRQSVRKMGKHFGGWNYETGGRAYGSMTCAGICSSAIAMKHLTDDVSPKHDLRIRNGLSWLAQNFDPEKNPKKSGWDYYYIYSIERVGQILGIDFIGEHEWYPLGAKSLVKRQQKDGSWTGDRHESDPRLATAFALLFLTRATPQLDAEAEPEKQGPGKLTTGVTLPNRSHQVYLILDGSGSMLAEINGRQKFEIARRAVKDLINVLPAHTQVALRVYGHRKRAIEPGAEEDTALEVEWGPLDRRELSRTLDRLRPRGKTPLSLSLERAADDVGRARGDGQTIVVLLTDGGEDAGRNPVQAARAFGERTDARFYILGFDINRKTWLDQLREMARVSGGQYRPVGGAGRLAEDLKSIVYPEPPGFLVRNEKGNTAAEGTFDGEPIELAPGKYTLSAEYLGHMFNTEFWINAQATTRINFDASEVVPTEQVMSTGGRVPQQPNETAPASGNRNAAEEKAGDTPAPSPNFCTQCGAKLSPGGKFCTQCGHRLAD